jgi:lysophospholipase L1-like esterase
MMELQVALNANGQVPRRYLLYAEPLAREWEEAWQTFERVLTRLSDTVRRDGKTFAVLSVPAGQVVRPEVWQQLVNSYPAMASRKWDVLSAEKRLRLLTERQQIPLIAPLDAFVQAASTDPLFFQQVGHLTPRGHEVMAAALDAALAERGLVPAAHAIPSH